MTRLRMPPTHSRHWAAKAFHVTPRNQWTFWAMQRILAKHVGLILVFAHHGPFIAPPGATRGKNTDG